MSAVRFLDTTLDAPAANIALDEALLDRAERDLAGETLRVWESPAYFVALGTGVKWREEVFVSRCRSDGVTIVRRRSGGGTVLQGPGCLNFAVVLGCQRDQRLRAIRGSYAYVFERLVRAFEGRDIRLTPQLISDLTLNDRKVSGNAQHRKRRFILHHGTFLYDFDLQAISRYLREPSDQPAHRERRMHSDFLANLPAGRDEIVEIILDAFGPVAPASPSTEDIETCRALVAEKYGTDEWNFRR